MSNVTAIVDHNTVIQARKVLFANNLSLNETIRFFIEELVKGNPHVQELINQLLEKKKAELGNEKQKFDLALIMNIKNKAKTKEILDNLKDEDIYNIIEKLERDG